MNLKEYAQCDGLDLAALVKKGEVQPRELTKLALEAIRLVNSELNAVVETTEVEAEKLLSKGPAKGAFEGVPFLVKDIGAHFENIKSEFGSRLFQGLVAPYDVELARRYRESGLVFVGRSNIPEFGASVSTESLLHGPCKNPWNTDYSPGGSSGGAAAAVASGMVPFAHANDGGGSIRAPASSCGLFGLKPTRNRNPSGPDASELILGLGCEHIVSRTVRDSAAMLDATHGSDVGAQHLLPDPPTSYLEASLREPQPLRIGFCITSPGGAPKLHEECRLAILNTAKLCEDLGHHVEEASPEFTHEESYAIFRDIGAPPVAAGINNLLAAMGKRFDPSKLELTTKAIYDRGMNMTAVDLVNAFSTLNRVTRRVGAFFQKYDVWLSPVYTSPGVKLGHLNANEDGLDADQWVRKLMDHCAFCCLFNGTGQPAMSIPLYRTAAGLPVGSHFVARYGDEYTLFSLAGQLERAAPWSNHIPAVSVLKI